MRTGDRDLIRDLNISIVLNTIRQHQPIARTEIAARTGLSPATVTGITARLLAEGWIREAGFGEASGGRRPILLRLDARSRFSVGVKLAADEVSAAVGDLGADLLEVVTLPLPQEAPGIVEQVAEAVLRALRGAGVARSAVIGVGVALPGVVDPVRGLSLFAPWHPWEHFPLKSQLEERLGLPVLLENDANAFTLAERWFGAGRGAHHLVGVMISAGIGAGVVIDGHVYRGAAYAAGEIGHLVVEPEGPACVCGQHGCLEAVAGDRALAREGARLLQAGRAPVLARLAGGDPARVRRQEVVEAARRGDAACRQLLERAGETIGRAVAAMVNTLNPEAVVVGGGLPDQAGPLLLEPLRRAVDRHAFHAPGHSFRVLPAGLGERAWLVGALTLAVEEAFRAPIPV
ncbi:MAG: ROK family transcriptional regulator [Firmicutes bacterium]|nr:ROK family transcriptional regulator [Bacillota bacterium]